MNSLVQPPPRETPEEPLVGNYFVAAYPPFSAWHPSQNAAVEEVLRQPASGAPLGVYVHVPFCPKKCDYCYYLSYTGQSRQAVDNYLQAVARELSLYSRQPALQQRPLAFVYFGGGTPSTLTVLQLRALVNGLKSALPWHDAEEITFECAPRSVRKDFLEELYECGVTRISMGVQSFDNQLLKSSGRIHLAEDVLRAYKEIRETGFRFVNLDLMAGLPGETKRTWAESVRRMIELDPDSVTIYQTEIPHNTQLYRELIKSRRADSIVSWDTKRELLDYAFEELDRAGYTVVNAYSAVKEPLQHDFKYQRYLWGGADMIGLGVASFSYFGGVHYQNEVTLEPYLARVNADALPVKRACRLSPKDQFIREFILQLKTGFVSRPDFETRFGASFEGTIGEPLQRLQEERFLTVSAEGVELTNEGLLRVDRLLPEFYECAYKNARYT
jgi:oxygen-independent coproporphyrinogen III oxidase